MCIIKSEMQVKDKELRVCRLFCHLMTIAFPKICYKESEIMITSLHPINKVSKAVRCARTSSSCAFRNQVPHLTSFYFVNFHHISNLQT
jgi:hypothetical protein